MYEKPDPVDRALNLLRNQSWAHDAHDAKIEENLMQIMDKQRQASRLTKRNVLAGVLTVLLLTGVGFAAAGGVDTVKNWFGVITIEFTNSEGGGEFDMVVEEMTENEDGTYTIKSKNGEVTAVVEVELVDEHE